VKIVVVIMQLAKAAFQTSKDPLDAALFYLAMKKKNLLWGLFRFVNLVGWLYCRTGKITSLKVLFSVK
jgi:RAVE protein 1 C terminal